MFDALLRRQNCQVVKRFGVVLQKLTHTDSLIETQVRIKDLVKETCFREKKKFKGYFIENLFLNKFQETVLEYPQLNYIKDVKDLEKQCRYTSKYLTRSTEEETTSEDNSGKVVSTVKKFEFTGFKLPLSNMGYGYLNSEYTRMLETLSANPSLAKVISENEDFGIELIRSFGSASQKDEYLLKLAQGEIMACFAHSESEPLVSLEPDSTSTNAVMTSDGQSYIVNGKKNSVYNATYADLIVFSANVTTTNLNGESKTGLTLFVVDKNKASGIKVHEPLQAKGLNGVDICDVTFNDVVIPSVCVLGEINKGSDIIKKIQTSAKLSNSAQSITIMKKLLNKAIDHCINNKFFETYKSERDYYKIKIGELSSRLYSVESMTYLVSGRMDSFDDPDLFLESLALKLHTSETLQYILQQTFSILGPDVFSSDNDYQELIKESQYYICSQDRNSYLKLAISTAGCKHVMDYKEEVNFFVRILNEFTKQNLLSLVETKKANCINPNFILSGYLHLMFGQESCVLEDCVLCLKKTVNHLFKNYKKSILERHIELQLLADVVVDIYAMTATLARASRAYCICTRNFEFDRGTAWAETSRLRYNIYATIKSINAHVKSQELRELSSRITDSESTRRHHPLIQNFLTRSEQAKSKVADCAK